MTRRDFEPIAKVLHDAKPPTKGATVGEKLLWGKIVQGLTEVMKAHPRFDPERFRRACEGRGP
jgi:hypothetical protein